MSRQICRAVTAICLSMTGLHAGHVVAQDMPGSGSAHPWRPYLDFGPRFADGDNDTVVDLYLPLGGDSDHLVMGTLRGLSSTDDREFLSAGLIARWLDAGERPEDSWIYGGSLFADIPHTAAGNTFVGVGAGVEAMSADWDLRLNGYLPLDGSGRNDDHAAVLLEGERIFLRGGEEHWLAGFDAEAGWRLPFDEPGGATEAWLRGGGYWFDHPDTADRHGFTASAELVWREVPWEAIPFTEFRVEAGIREDSVTGTEGYLGLRARIDLGLFANDWPAPRNPVARRMEDPWRRLDRPFLDGAATGPDEPVIDPATGRVLTEVIHLDPGNPHLSAGSGSPAAGPAMQPGTAVNDTSDGRLILVSGTIPGTVALREGDTILGGGIPLPLVGASSGFAATFTPDLEGGTILTGGTAGLQLASDTRVTGLRFEGVGTDGEVGIGGGDSLANVTIDRISITGVGGSGIETGSGLTGFRLTGSRIVSGGLGLGFGADARDVFIADNLFSDLTQQGVAFHGSADISISGNSFGDIGKSAIIADGAGNHRWQVSGNSFHRIGASGMIIDHASDLLITDNQLQAIGENGIQAGGMLRGVTLAGNRMNGVEGTAVYFAGAFLDRIEIVANMLENIGGNASRGSGIVVDGDFISQLDLRGNLIDEGSGNLGIGILVGPGQTLAIEGNTVLGSVGAGISLASGSSSGAVSGNVIQTEGVGIAIGNPSGVSANQGIDIIGNTIHGGRLGLAFSGEQTGHTVEGNLFSGMERGILFDGVANTVSLIDNSFANLSGNAVIFQRPVISVEISRNSFTGFFGDSLFVLAGTNIAGGFSGSGNVREGHALTDNACIETVPALSGDGFSFVDGVACGRPE